MKCSDIIAVIEKAYPPKMAEEWDNPGLLVGRSDREVEKIVVALDATDEVVECAVREKAQMLFTHHPLIFGSVRKVNDQDFLGRRILTLIENGISYYAAHTNYDVCRMADLNEMQLGLTDTEVLEVTVPGSSQTDTGDADESGKTAGNEGTEGNGGSDRSVETEGNVGPAGIGRVGTLKAPMKYSALAALAKKAFDISSVKVFRSGPEDDPVVSRVAVSGGAGKSMVQAAIEKGAEVLITGDIDHHTGIDALASGLHIIDAGHYGTEHCFIKDAAESLRTAFPGLAVVEAEQPEPFFVM